MIGTRVEGTGQSEEGMEDGVVRWCPTLHWEGVVDIGEEHQMLLLHLLSAEVVDAAETLREGIGI